MTEKLYDTDAYLQSFTAKVLDCIPVDGGYDLLLDRTAFFPEKCHSAENRLKSNPLVRGARAEFYHISPVDLIKSAVEIFSMKALAI